MTKDIDVSSDGRNQMKSRITVEKSANVKTWEKWLESEDGQSCTRGEARDQYLKNRLWYAFMAGYEAAKERTRG